MAKKSKGKTVAANGPESPSSSFTSATSASAVPMHVVSPPRDSSSGSGSSSEMSKRKIAASRDDTSSVEVGAAPVDGNAIGDSEEEEEQLPEIRVNKWSLHELKMACDDAVKQYLSKPSQFKPRHVHTDVRLGLGWTASLIALGASLYAYKVPFQQSRDYVLLAVIVYIILSAILAVYVRYVEKDTIFEGSRKVFAGRIETQSLSVRSSCEAYTPIYHIDFSYTHSSNAGKTLIRQFNKDITKPFNEIFDDDGMLVREELEKVVKSVVDEATGQ